MHGKFSETSHGIHLLLGQISFRPYAPTQQPIKARAFSMQSRNCIRYRRWRRGPLLAPKVGCFFEVCLRKIGRLQIRYQCIRSRCRTWPGAFRAEHRVCAGSRQVSLFDCWTQLRPGHLRLQNRCRLPRCLISDFPKVGQLFQGRFRQATSLWRKAGRGKRGRERIGGRPSRWWHPGAST